MPCRASITSRGHSQSHERPTTVNTALKLSSAAGKNRFHSRFPWTWIPGLVPLLSLFFVGLPCASAQDSPAAGAGGGVPTAGVDGDAGFGPTAPADAVPDGFGLPGHDVEGSADAGR